MPCRRDLRSRRSIIIIIFISFQHGNVRRAGNGGKTILTNRTPCDNGTEILRIEKTMPEYTPTNNNSRNLVIIINRGDE